MPLGVHVSIAGGVSKSVERAQRLGCDAMQIFGRNPRSWIYTPLPEAEARLFRHKRKEAGLFPVVVHTNYLINLTAPDDGIFHKSIDMFKKELGIAEALGADYLVTHLGSPQEMGPAFALKRVSLALLEVARSGLGRTTRVLLENTSGSGTGFGSKLDDIGRIIRGAKESGLDTGLCFDTCHAFAAGYSFSTPQEADSLVKRIEAEAGRGSLRVIHLNDSRGGFGSKLDRHADIGKGAIGSEAFRHFLNHPKIKKVPMILETPKDSDEDDLRNLAEVRRILGA
ncbi:MAG: deoxyribonuclease IV [Deltaproteobacteria bacterium]|nr:deoxyribonuclease IV [Deltaproteobacteria bacterium]MBZ0220091.1 deoxyribonuclease IV [Deltaproteobacteria bacterium]